MTSEQVSEWEAFNRLEPIGDWINNFRLAYLCSLITNLTISVHGKKTAKFSSPSDFLIEWDVEAKEPKKQTAEEMKQILMSFAKDHNERLRKEKAINNRPPRIKPTKTKGL